MKLTRISALVLTGAVAVALTACEPKDSGDGASGDTKSEAADSQADSQEAEGDEDSPAGPVEVTLTKSGGISSAMTETLEVGVDGKWSYVKARMAPKKGDLSEDDLVQVTKLADPEDIGAKDAPKSDKQCNDMKQYELTIAPEKGDKLEMKTDECGVPPNDNFGEIVEILTEATPI